MTYSPLFFEPQRGMKLVEMMDDDQTIGKMCSETSVQKFLQYCSQLLLQPVGACAISFIKYFEICSWAKD
jgi:hypothetical protein